MKPDKNTSLLPESAQELELRTEIEEALLKDAIVRHDIYETATRRKKVRELRKQLEAATS